MKQIILIFMILYVNSVFSQKKLYTEKQAQIFRTLINDCRIKEGATTNDIDDILDDKEDISQPAKCTVACFLEKNNVIVNGKFQPKGIIDIAQFSSMGNDKIVRTAIEITNECNKISHENRCELAILVTQCMVDSAEKHGVL